MSQTDERYITLDLVSKAINLDKQKIYAIYQFGSRVYQSNSPNSDYDIFVVYGTEKDLDDVVENEEYNIGAHINDIQTFKKYLKNHNACVLQTLWLPEKFLIFENEEMSAFRKNFMISMKKMERGFLRVEGICYLKSKREFLVDKKKSLKNMVHGVRFLKFGIEIAKTGRIQEWTVGNKFQEYMSTLEYDTWEEYYNKFEKFYKDFHKEFSDFVFDEKQRIYEKYAKNESSEKLQLCHFLKENKIEDLTKYFSIQIEFLDSGMISFVIDPVFSNLTCLINKECQNPVILNEVIPDFNHFSLLI
jgi:predicted nucleotidyltransferase